MVFLISLKSNSVQDRRNLAKIIDFSSSQPFSNLSRTLFSTANNYNGALISFLDED